jgi:hypothetical protein
MYHVIMNDPMKTRKVLSCMAITAIIKNKNQDWLQKKTGNENFPNVNLVLSICQLIVCLTIPVK